MIYEGGDKTSLSLKSRLFCTRNVSGSLYSDCKYLIDSHPKKENAQVNLPIFYILYGPHYLP